MIRRIRQLLGNHFRNLRGWRTEKKIVVIESDDWGSMRMPDKSTYQQLLKKGIGVDKCPFLSNDSIASEQDLNGLFETLGSFKSKVDNSNVQFTFNCIMANPNFQAIKESDYTQYFYEHFHDTADRHNRGGIIPVWKQAIAEGLMDVAFHGREHINLVRWMSLLKSGSKDIIDAFDREVYGLSTTVSSDINRSILAAYDSDSEGMNYAPILKEGLTMFDITFGKRANSFIAPNYVYNSDLEPVLFEEGIFNIQTNGLQQVPSFAKLKGLKNIKRVTGEKNFHGQIYTARNVSFEPTINRRTDVVDVALKEIEVAFTWKKPAIINSHRLNYIGVLNPSNRDKNLKKLSDLLKGIQKKWPDTIFMNSNSLYHLISNI